MLTNGIVLQRLARESAVWDPREHRVKTKQTLRALVVIQSTAEELLGAITETWVDCDPEGRWPDVGHGAMIDERAGGKSVFVTWQPMRSVPTEVREVFRKTRKENP